MSCQNILLINAERFEKHCDKLAAISGEDTCPAHWAPELESITLNSPQTVAEFFLDNAAIQRLREAMLRFARLQLPDAGLAEDMVQEALATAFKSHAQFEARSTVSTWIFSILRNKILDLLRQGWHKRRIEFNAKVETDEDFDALFRPNGHWNPQERPSDWGNPQQQTENQQFWQVFEACVARLSPATAQIFTLREVMGLEVDEICKETGITTSNCWVILHRARMALRLCMEQRWFDKDAS